MTPSLHRAHFAELGVDELYALLRLRVDVFVVEQDCPYPELDGRDTEAGTQHLWLSEGPEILALLRILDDDGVAWRIGRVATASTARGRGLAAQLMAAALDACPGRDIVLDAQSHLAGWYARFGFVVDGAEFIEDGIPHLPMRRAQTAD